MRSVRPHSNGDARRGARRRRRHVALHHLEHPGEVAVREPGRQRNPAARAAHARELARGGFGAAGEHDAAGGDDGVERAGPRRGGAPRRRAGTSIGRPSTSACARAAASRSAAMSAPTTDAPRRATSRDVQPVPVDRSRIRSPGCGSSRITQCSIESAMPRLISVVVLAARAPDRRGPLVVPFDGASHAVPPVQCLYRSIEIGGHGTTWPGSRPAPAR